MKTIRPDSQTLYCYVVGIPLGILFAIWTFLILLHGGGCTGGCYPDEKSNDYVGGAMITFGIAAACLWGSFNQLKRRRGEPEATITPDVLIPGERFRFICRQPRPKDSDFKSIAFYLVFRESVSYGVGDEAESKKFDRLVQQFTYENTGPAVGEDLFIEHEFEIPNREMGTRNPYMGLRNIEVTTSWHIVAIINQNSGDYKWFDFGLKVQGAVNPDVQNAGGEEDELFDLFLVGQQLHCSANITRALEDLLPYWRVDLRTSYSDIRPFLVLERLTKSEAETIKVRLEAAGGMLVIWPVGLGANDTGQVLKNIDLLSESDIAKTELDIYRPGESVRFIYELEGEQTKFTFLGVFLIYCETVEHNEIEKTFERLVQQFTLKNWYYRPDGKLVIKREFEIPNRAMGIRNPYMDQQGARVKETSWFIRVVIDPGKATYSSRDYPLLVRGADAANEPASSEDDELFNRPLS